MNYKNKNIKIISLIYIFISIMLAILVSVQPYILKNIIDNYRNISVTKNNIIKYGVSILGIIIFEYITKILLIKLTVNMKRIMISQIIGFVEQDETLFKNNDYVADINVDINNNVEDFIKDYYINKLDIIILLVNMLIYSFAIINLDFVLILLILIPNILTLSIPYIFKSRVELYKNENIEKNKLFNSIILDYTLGINVIRNMLATFEFKKVVNKTMNDNLYTESKFGYLESSLEILIGCISYIGLFILICYGSVSIYYRSMTLGAFIAAIQFSDIIISPLIRLITSINILSSGRASYKTLVKRYYEKAKEETNSKKSYHNHDFNNIEINNLQFSYYDSLNVDLSNIIINKSNKILIKGNSGSGKSTLLRIITGKIKNYNGDIYINGHNLKELDNAYINRYFSIIPQFQYIFNTSVDNNIALYSSIDFNDFRNVFDLFQYDKISKKDPTSQSLSGGEKQRIALLRAIIRNKDILIVDEGLNQVQKELRNEILEFLLNDKNLTFIYVSHDIDDYIDRFDLVIDMNKGMCDV